MHRTQWTAVLSRWQPEKREAGVKPRARSISKQTIHLDKIFSLMFGLQELISRKWARSPPEWTSWITAGENNTESRGFIDNMTSYKNISFVSDIRREKMLFKHLTAWVSYHNNCNNNSCYITKWIGKCQKKKYGRLFFNRK